VKVLIIEDEALASKHLTGLLAEIGNIEVQANLDSIKSSVAWLTVNPTPDLIFMDIHIADGSAFKIFDLVEVDCPVIFTTAYDEYAIQAFKVNSIDYLLKPLTIEAIKAALTKFKKISGQIDFRSELKMLLKSIKTEKRYKSTLLVSAKGSRLIPLQTSDIAFFYIDNQVVKAITNDNNSFSIDYSLEQLAEQLDPAIFYRANRQFIVSKNAVRELDLWFNHRLSVHLKVPTPSKILISKVKVTEFREWLTSS
jgi:DNA-binding LytR/AlgR family response regulator